MKKIFIIATLLTVSAVAFAQRGGGGGGGNLGGGGGGNRPQQQQTPAVVAPPLAARDVSGVVKDEKGETVIGAAVVLKSAKDTISVGTNEDGVFIIRGVKSNTFNVSVSSLGLLPFVQKYAFSDTKKNVVLDPITLKTNAKELGLVTINGTPSVVYKTDTVEYRASDYKVRENATVDELLKKMEGMEVGTDGSLVHQGTEVVRAKLNGKEYSGGSVAQAIQNLPADIVEKIQIVDDYGDQAARTGVKEGDPSKILNITTKADRSVGNTARITGQYGSAGRYNGQIFAQRINANQQIGIIGNIRNTVLGVASTGAGGGNFGGGGGNGGGGNGGGGGGGGGNGASGGVTHSGSPSVNYRDQWGKNIQVIGSYDYNFNNNNSLNDQYGFRNSVRGKSDFVTKSNADRNSNGHNARWEMDINLDSANYLQITPNFSTSSSTNASTSYNKTINYYQQFEHALREGTNSTVTDTKSFGIAALYLHVFKKPKRSFSLNLSINRSDNQTDGKRNTRIRNYADTTENVLVRDSLISVLNTRDNVTTNFSASVSYVEPISTLSVIEFSGSISRRNNSSISLQDTVDKNGKVYSVPAFSSIYDFNVTDTRGTLNYRYNGSKVTFSIGASAVPFNISGTKLNAAVGTNPQTSLSNFRVIPSFRFGYSWSRTERITINYNGRNQEPNFTQIQPFTDISDPNNVIIGNPNLKPTFTHSINAQYNNYLANSKFNFSLGITANQVQNSITQNTVERAILIYDDPDPKKDLYRYMNEVYYVNISGAQSVTGRYNISKQSNNRAVNLALNGSITYSYTPAMSNDQPFHQTNWRFNERFGPRITPTENIEINPFIGYDISRYFTTLVPKNAVPGAATNNSTQLNTTSLGLNGRMYFFKTWQINYDATKRYISGITGGNTTPLIINAGFEKEFLDRKNLVLTLNVYDVLKQNNFIQQSVNTQGTTNTISNALSRYFMVGLRLNLQKWSGTPQRGGRNMQRRGDGSFIYN